MLKRILVALQSCSFGAATDTHAEEDIKRQTPPGMLFPKMYSISFACCNSLEGVMPGTTIACEQVPVGTMHLLATRVDSRM
jgi:hypothetical protein